MHYRREVFVEQLGLVHKFVKHVIHYRAIHPYFSPVNLTTLGTAFWSDTSDAHLMQAIVNWCKVFGSEKSNQTHWKKLSPHRAHELRDSFRDDLFASTSMIAAEWEAFHQGITAFRDRYVAHRDVEFSQPVPVLDRALQVAEHYDRWIRKVIFPDQLDMPPLGLLVVDLRIKVEAEVQSVMRPFIRDAAQQ